MKIVNIPVSKFSVASVVQEINRHVAGRNVEGLFFNNTSMLRGTLEIHTSEPETIITEGKTVIIERPSKFKQNASSQYYCVYKKENSWTYKFVNKKLSPKPFLGKRYNTEIEAAHAYDEHRYSVEGDLSKLNFPENYTKGDK